MLLIWTSVNLFSSHEGLTIRAQKKTNEYFYPKITQKQWQIPRHLLPQVF